MNTILAIGLQVVASVLFAVGAILQSLAVRADFDPAAKASSNTLSFKGLLKQFTKPRWLVGLLCVLGGAALHLVALSMAPVAVVQPIGILAVPWAVLLASRVHRHHVTSRVWLAVGITIVGVVGFTVFSSLFATGRRQSFDFVPIAASFVVVLIVAAGLSWAAARAVAWARAMLWAAVGAIFYGLASGMMKAAMNLVQRHEESLLHWQVLVLVGFMVACYVLGVWMIQQGYASGPAEITVGIMTTVDPFVAVVFGLLVLGEGIGMPMIPILAMAGFFGLAVLGVARLSRDHPDAVRERELEGESVNPAR